jgi:hypothetical protein
MSSTQLKHWMTLASTPEQEALAHRAGTTRPYLYHLTSTNAKAAREAQPALAKRIEEVTKDLHRASQGRLPVVYRTDLNAACRACEFARQCLGSKAVASDFDRLPASHAQQGFQA